MGKSGAINKLMATHLGKGHILYFENWYASPSLCEFLHANKTGSCGTARKNRKFMPKFDGQKTIFDNPAKSDNEPPPRPQDMRRTAKGRLDEKYI